MLDPTWTKLPESFTVKNETAPLELRTCNAVAESELICRAPVLSILSLVVPFTWKSKKLPDAKLPLPEAKLNSRPVPVNADVLCVILMSAPVVRAVLVRARFAALPVWAICNAVAAVPVVPLTVSAVALLVDVDTVVAPFRPTAPEPVPKVPVPVIAKLPLV